MRYKSATGKSQKFWVRVSWLGLLFVIFSIILIKFITLESYDGDYLFATYSIIVSAYILLRFGLSYFYEPDPARFDTSKLPSVVAAVPVKNEEKDVYKTLLRIAKSDYPRNKLSIIAINDGSTDNTLAEIKRAKKDIRDLGIKVKIIDWKINQGKREGMAETVRQADSEIILFVDSDSFIEKDTLRELVKYFNADPKIGAVSAHTYVYNSNDNLLTKLQGIHYFLSFKIFKGTEALFGAVTCCPGSCTAYRLGYIRPEMEEWSEESFLGVRCTYGDDRSLTNFLLKRGYKTVYSPTARARTIVPNKLKQFYKQQVRWKKSWTRESLLATRYFWRMNPMMVLIFYTGFALTFLTPFIVIRALIWYPLTTGQIAVTYLIGLTLTSGLFSFFYRSHTQDNKWYFGFLYSFFYSLMLSWLLFYAVPTIRDQKWGTR